MKRQLYQQQDVQHMLRIARNQAKITVVKTPKTKHEEPKIEKPKPEITTESIKLATTGSETKSSKK